ncbi:D-alanyl-D-alanine carboxypeptidase [Pantanalinema rosaneae CENA516]|uniref:D-alanyl-D-alanine carboxypeptidase n=1 Tax=Pantanalinema rosaneae TaxID=1620701 RepID=UPI003D6EA8DB
MLNRYPSLLALLTLLLTTAGCTSPELPNSASSPSPSVSPVVTPVPSPSVALLAAGQPNSTTNAQLQAYVSQLATQGFAANGQGVWIQTDQALLANHQGSTPLSAASLTKVATSLAALQTLTPDHRFVTEISTTGTIQNGVLNGDLVIQGGEDPFFVWEEAIAVGNALNRLNIRRVTGNLIVVGKFYMNFEFDPLQSGALFKQAINAATWTGEVATQYQTLPAGTPKPQVAIAGTVQRLATLPATAKPRLRHSSLPLAELLKKMNRYSNNAMAEMIADSVGGAQAVAQKVVAVTGVAANEVQLVNGSGLSVDNRLSPRTVAAMFRAIDRYLQPYQMTIADIFTQVGQDEGILDQRPLPNRAVLKSGSLDAVSALAGALPTENQGVVWFVIMNGGTNLEGFRASQEALLQQLVNQWGAARSLPTRLTPNPERDRLTSQIDVVQ